RASPVPVFMAFANPARLGRLVPADVRLSGGLSWGPLASGIRVAARHSRLRRAFLVALPGEWGDQQRPAETVGASRRGRLLRRRSGGLRTYWRTVAGMLRFDGGGRRRVQSDA